MRVLVTADAVGGVFTYAAELARGLAPRGVEVALAIEGALPARDQLRALEGIPGLSIHARPCRLEWMEEPWEDVDAAGRWLLELERAERPDVVHLDAFSHGALPFRAPKLVVGHSCVLSWFEAVRGVPAPPAWDRYRARVRAGLRGADAVAAPSAAMLAALERLYGPLRRAHVVPNGRDPGRFPAGDKEDLVLASGRLWDEAKNAAALVRIAPRLPWPVLVAGEAAAPDPAAAPAPAAIAPGEAVLAARGGGEAILLGRLPERDLARWLARAAIFAHPARYEPFGLGVLEAALAGCALVLGDVPSLRENWDGAAAFAPPGDDDALRDAVVSLTRDRRLRGALAAAARARALDLGVDRMAGRTLELYRDLVARRRRAS